MSSSLLRVFAIGVCFLVASLAPAAVGLADSPAPSFRDYIRDVQHLQQAHDWAGLERLAQDAIKKFRDHPESQDALIATYWLANAFQGESRHKDAGGLSLRVLAGWEKMRGREDFFAGVIRQNRGTVYLNESDVAKGEP